MNNDRFEDFARGLCYVIYFWVGFFAIRQEPLIGVLVAVALLLVAAFCILKAGCTSLLKPSNQPARRFLAYASLWFLAQVGAHFFDLELLGFIVFLSPAIYFGYKHIAKCFKDYDETYGQK